MNLAKGITECRVQTYKNLKFLLKPIPLETPTWIELSPGEKIQVTLFDANHMVDAVSFLIEGIKDAILYTGDVRAEPWWVNSLIRQPKLISYTQTLCRRRLSNIYLDTTFASEDPRYRDFRPKTEGIAELLEKVAKLPIDTNFYFHAWTFGYEDVWCALSQALDSPIHLDPYRLGLYSSLARSCGPGLERREAPVFCGVKVANLDRPGNLTRDTRVRLHSCEQGTECSLMSSKTANQVVRIKPIISRHDGQELLELGAGGGRGGLSHRPELDIADPRVIPSLQKLFDLNDAGDTKQEVLNYLQELREKGRTRMGLDTANVNPGGQSEQIPLNKLPGLLARLARDNSQPADAGAPKSCDPPVQEPYMITFPYSRHSSFTELRHLVFVFQPRDIYPCTAPPAKDFSEARSMSSLFGDLLPSDTHFSWDERVRREKAHLRRQEWADLDRHGRDLMDVDNVRDAEMDEEIDSEEDGGFVSVSAQGQQDTQMSIGGESEPEQDFCNTEEPRDDAFDPEQPLKKGVSAALPQHAPRPLSPKAQEKSSTVALPQGRKRAPSLEIVLIDSGPTEILARSAKKAAKPVATTTPKTAHDPQKLHPGNAKPKKAISSEPVASPATKPRLQSLGAARLRGYTPRRSSTKRKGNARATAIGSLDGADVVPRGNRDVGDDRDKVTSPSARLSLREFAHEAALAGEWHRVPLMSTCERSVIAHAGAMRGGRGREPSPEL